METPRVRRRGRGFASMSLKERRRMSGMGGKASHAAGTAHMWTAGPDGTAAEAGRKGGAKGRGKPKRKRKRAT